MRYLEVENTKSGSRTLNYYNSVFWSVHLNIYIPVELGLSQRQQQQHGACVSHFQSGPKTANVIWTRSGGHLLILLQLGGTAAYKLMTVYRLVCFWIKLQVQHVYEKAVQQRSLLLLEKRKNNMGSKTEKVRESHQKSLIPKTSHTVPLKKNHWLKNRQ